MQSVTTTVFMLCTNKCMQEGQGAVAEPMQPMRLGYARRLSGAGYHPAADVKPAELL